LAAGLAAALLVASVSLLAAGKELTGDRIAAKEGELVVHPVNHATLALGWQGKTVYVDPVGGAQRFAELPAPDLVLVTHLHGDHFDAATLKGVLGAKTALVAPPTVVEQLPAELRPRAISLANGQSQELLGLKVEAVPAYNLTPDRLQYHPKGRDNGYVLHVGGLRVYLSGDTEAVPEMLALKGIDVAFVCVNLPYTMDIEQAARAAREFRPKILYPYHCRGSDLEKLKELVGDKEGIEVRLRDWYKR
jgi:L-ascorbate metabolism protein UlaG (beta-lactamase superfamily)